MPLTPPAPRLHSRRSIPIGDTDPFAPSAERPVRVRSRQLLADSHFEPHRHAWLQLACSASGVLQVSANSEKRNICDTACKRGYDYSK
jgi:hypothetical protein